MLSKSDKINPVEPLVVGFYNDSDINLIGYLDNPKSIFDKGPIVEHGGQKMLLAQLEKFSQGAIEWNENADQIIEP